LINPVGGVVKRVVMESRANDKILYKVEFYDKHNTLLLKSGIEKEEGDEEDDVVTKEFELADNERLIGFKSKNTCDAEHYDPFFVIGRLE
jgi:hypothetical protein